MNSGIQEVKKGDEISNLFELKEGFQKKNILENSNKALTPPPYWGKKTKNYVRAKKLILYDMGNFLHANRPSYGLSLFYF